MTIIHNVLKRLAVKKKLKKTGKINYSICSYPDDLNFFVSVEFILLRLFLEGTYPICLTNNRLTDLVTDVMTTIVRAVIREDSINYNL